MRGDSLSGVSNFRRGNELSFETMGDDYSMYREEKKDKYKKNKEIIIIITLIFRIVTYLFHKYLFSRISFLSGYLPM